MDINDLTIGQAKELTAMFPASGQQQQRPGYSPHPMLGRRCLLRTFSAGVHIGTVIAIDGMEVLLKDSKRLWRWEGGGLSLSAVANDGIKGGRLNDTGEIYLTQVIEFIPTTDKAEKTFEKFTE